MKELKFFTLLIGFFSFFLFASAQEIDFYFNPNGGKPSTSGFSLNANNGFIVYGSSAYATYKDDNVISTINSISGKAFTLTKSGDSLVPGREWYLKNVNDGKVYYFSQSKMYQVKSILRDLSYESDESFISIDLYANWNHNPETGGIDITSLNGDDPGFTIMASETTIAVGETTTLSTRGTYDTVTWTSSNKKVATVNSSGVVKGVKKGTVTITGKTRSGSKATVQIKVSKNKVYSSSIFIHMNGGSLSVNHGEGIATLGEYITYNGSTEIQKLAYGTKTTKSGLVNPDNPNYINITRKGYTIKEGAEWNTSPDGSGKSYSDSKVYSAKNICNSSRGDCSITLYVNWVKLNDYLKVDSTVVSLDILESKRIEVDSSDEGYLNWSVENSNIASVSNGVITGLNAGETKVTVQSSKSPKLKETIYVAVKIPGNNIAKATKKVDNRGKTLVNLGTIDLSNYKKNCVKVPTTDKASVAQGFTVAGDYYIAAKRNSGETRGSIFAIHTSSSKKSTASPNIVGYYFKMNYFGHANGIGYNQYTGKIYIVATTNMKYKTFQYQDIGNQSNPTFLEGSIYRYTDSSGIELYDATGIDYSSYDNKFYLGSGGNLYVYDSTLSKNEMHIIKAAKGGSQDLCAYNGKILTARWNSFGVVGGDDLENTRNAIDVYRAMDGNYLGTYVIKSTGEIEGISYNPKTGKFAFFFQNVDGQDLDCISEAYIPIS